MDEKNPGHQAARESAGASHFLAILSRMKYIERWSLMRNSRPENLSEHSLEVALIAHMLCVIGNARHGRSLDAEPHDGMARLPGVVSRKKQVIPALMATLQSIQEDQD